jgi:hypothetical protein
MCRRTTSRRRWFLRPNEIIFFGGPSNFEAITLGKYNQIKHSGCPVINMITVNVTNDRVALDKSQPVKFALNH